MAARRVLHLLPALVLGTLMFVWSGKPAVTIPTATPQSSPAATEFPAATCLPATEWASPPMATIPFATTNNIVGPPRGSANRAIAFARTHASLRLPEVEGYIHEIYALAPVTGFDPALLVAQSALETANWSSYWWVQRLNPAGLGITGHPPHEASSPQFQDGAAAARAHLAHMHAEVYGKARPLPMVLQGADPTYQRVFSAGWAGTVQTVEDLSGTWAVDPGYAAKIIGRARRIFGEG